MTRHISALRYASTRHGPVHYRRQADFSFLIRAKFRVSDYETGTVVISGPRFSDHLVRPRPSFRCLAASEFEASATPAFGSAAAALEPFLHSVSPDAVVDDAYDVADMALPLQALRQFAREADYSEGTEAGELDG